MRNIKSRIAWIFAFSVGLGWGQTIVTFTSLLNSTITTLAADAVYTGTFETTVGRPCIAIQVRADKASATNGLEFHWSTDGVNPSDTITYTVPANANRSFAFYNVRPFFRTKYTNGSTDQGSFQLSTISRVDCTGMITALPPTQEGASAGSGSEVTVTNPSLAVTGTFWQATQPVSGTFFQATQPVSGTFWQATQPVSASSLPLPAGASTSAKQPALGTAGTASTDVITIQGIASMTKLLVTPDSVALPANQTVDVARIGGTATVNGGLAGSVAIGGTAPSDAVIDQKPVLIGAEVLSQGTQPAAATSGRQRRILSTVEGVQFVQEGNSNRFSCFVTAVTATTQCQAAPGAGLRAYVTSAHMSNQAATVQTLDIIYGTGTNCATSPVAISHKVQFGTLATTTNSFVAQLQFPTPLIPVAANAICVRPSAATAFGATLTGFIAP